MQHTLPVSVYAAIMHGLHRRRVLLLWLAGCRSLLHVPLSPISLSLPLSRLFVHSPPCSVTILDTGSTSIADAVWHPLSTDHVVVVSAAGVDVFDVSSRSRLAQAAPPATATSSSSSTSTCPPVLSLPFAPGELLCPPVAACFGSARGWELLTLFILCEDASIHYVCPVVPPGCLLPASDWDALVQDCDAVMSSAGASEATRIHREWLLECWTPVPAADGAGAEPQWALFSPPEAHPHFGAARAADRLLPALQGPISVQAASGASSSSAAVAGSHLQHPVNAKAGHGSLLVRACDLFVVPASALEFPALVVAWGDGLVDGLVAPSCVLPGWAPPLTAAGAGSAGASAVAGAAGAAPSRRAVLASLASSANAAPRGAAGAGSGAAAASGSPVVLGIRRLAPGAQLGKSDSSASAAAAKAAAPSRFGGGRAGAPAAGSKAGTATMAAAPSAATAALPWLLLDRTEVAVSVRPCAPEWVAREAIACGGAAFAGGLPPAEKADGRRDLVHCPALLRDPLRADAVLLVARQSVHLLRLAWLPWARALLASAAGAASPEAAAAAVRGLGRRAASLAHRLLLDPDVDVVGVTAGPAEPGPAGATSGVSSVVWDSVAAWAIPRTSPAMLFHRGSVAAVAGSVVSLSLVPARALTAAASPRLTEGVATRLPAEPALAAAVAAFQSEVDATEAAAASAASSTASTPLEKLLDAECNGSWARFVAFIAEGKLEGTALTGQVRSQLAKEAAGTGGAGHPLEPSPADLRALSEAAASVTKAMETLLRLQAIVNARARALVDESQALVATAAGLAGEAAALGSANAELVTRAGRLAEAAGPAELASLSATDAGLMESAQAVLTAMSLASGGGVTAEDKVCIGALAALAQELQPGVGRTSARVAGVLGEAQAVLEAAGAAASGSGSADTQPVLQTAYEELDSVTSRVERDRSVLASLEAQLSSLTKRAGGPRAAARR